VTAVRRRRAAATVATAAATRASRADRHTVLRQHRTRGLDTPAKPDPTIGAGHLVVLVLGNEPNYRLPGRSSSAPKKIAAAFKISLARRSWATSLRSAPYSPQPSATSPSAADLRRPPIGGSRSAASPGSDPQHAPDRGDCRPLRRVLRPHLNDHAHRTLPKLIGAHQSLRTCRDGSGRYRFTTWHDKRGVH
jgi:hypothetical protein